MILSHDINSAIYAVGSNISHQLQLIGVLILMFGLILSLSCVVYLYKNIDILNELMGRSV